ncbi:hypothetical protein GCM10025864_42070 [Luteimicrobium album]|uniref:Uncharacterized protein n=1 Tax=Luteimicrobium album TaxID=1054550 RepID=A0ABQ6I8G0_9MICO|nr:hypothetical protein GCM10025864_42070 [Luteimicrobium album]
MDVRSTCPAAASSSVRPTAVDPVNDSLRSRGSESSGPVTADADDVGTTFTTPTGRSRSASSERRISARARVVSGVSRAGLITTGHPAARAGASLRVSIAMGKFQGVTSSAGPTGRRDTSCRAPPAGAGRYRPSNRTACSANQRRKSAP